MVETTLFIIDLIYSIEKKGRFVLTNNGWFTDSLLVECGVQMVGNESNRTQGKREKNEGRLGRGLPLFFPSSIFCPRSTTWTPGIG